MIIFVRPATSEDSENFTKWYINSPSFDPNFHLLETYTLAAFRKDKILGYMVVESRESSQVLFCFVPNPGNSNLESASACREFFKTVVTLGFSSGKGEIFFCGNVEGTNKIASHYFTEIVDPEKKLFEGLPTYGLRLEDIK